MSGSEAWSVTDLADLKVRAASMGKAFDLKVLAVSMRRSVSDTDAALFALMGREPEDAAEILGGQPAPRVWRTKAESGFRKFLREVLR